MLLPCPVLYSPIVICFYLLVVIDVLRNIGSLRTLGSALNCCKELAIWSKWTQFYVPSITYYASVIYNYVFLVFSPIKWWKRKRSIHNCIQPTTVNNIIKALGCQGPYPNALDQRKVQSLAQSLPVWFNSATRFTKARDHFSSVGALTFAKPTRANELPI